MSERNFFSELKRRNVIRAAGLYLVGAWLVTQVASTILPMFGAPEWLPRTIVMLLAIGFIPALIFSWVFELTPDAVCSKGGVPARREAWRALGKDPVLGRVRLAWFHRRAQLSASS